MPAALPRRTLLRRAITALALAAGAGLVARLRTGGYDVPAATAPPTQTLSAAEYQVLRAAAVRICAADAPDAPTPEEAGVMTFVDGYIGRMDPALRRDLLRLVSYLEQLAPLRLGYASRFTRLAPADQDRVLAALEAADEGLLRGGFSGLKSLVFMGYYRHPRTWSIVGYGGPWIAS